MHGQHITMDIPKPLKYTLDPDYPGMLMPMYESRIPLMREDLIEVLMEAGVDNLQFFSALLRDTTNGEEYTNYKAFNVVGLVSCADMEKSVLMGSSDSEMIDVDFRNLVINESRTGGALIFRMAEAVSAIVIHESVKMKIEEKGIVGMTFYGAGEWAG